LLAALAEGGIGAPAGGLLPGPQWKMRVDIAREPCSPAPPGADPTIVISSPVSTAWTRKAGVPFGSRHVFSSLQRWGGLPSSRRVMYRAGEAEALGDPGEDG
jgi:hypothetical protein